MPDKTSGEILKSVLVAVIRHLLSIASAWLIKEGIVEPNTLSESNLLILAGGFAGALISLGWIIRNKLKTWNLVETARQSPSNTPIEIVKERAAEKPLI